MELSERYIETLEKEGFASVYEWQDAAGTLYPESTKSENMSIMVTDGSLIYSVNGQRKELVAGKRLNIPAGVPYSAVVGPQGWIGIIGEN